MTGRSYASLLEGTAKFALVQLSAPVRVHGAEPGWREQYGKRDLSGTAQFTGPGLWAQGRSLKVKDLWGFTLDLADEVGVRAEVRRELAGHKERAPRVRASSRKREVIMGHTQGRAWAPQVGCCIVVVGW